MLWSSTGGTGTAVSSDPIVAHTGPRSIKANSGAGNGTSFAQLTKGIADSGTRITAYLQDLAAAFHPYYNKHRVITEDRELTAARLLLVRSIRSVIANALDLLGVTSPEAM